MSHKPNINPVRLCRELMKAFPGLFCACAVIVPLLMLSSCDSKRVSLLKKPLKMETKTFDPNSDLSKIPLEKDEGAVTIWQFGCKADFDFDILEKTFLSNNDYIVSLRINRCRVTLTAPVTVYLPKDASRALVAHEMGHVDICKRVYDRVDNDALALAEGCVGKTYQASGSTVEKACQKAIEDASRSIYDGYHQKASLAVNEVSELYDELDRKEPGSVKSLVDKAFARHVRQGIE